MYKVMNRRWVLYMLVSTLVIAAEYRDAFSQVNSVFFLEVSNTNGDNIDINGNIAGDNAFSKVRGKMFLNSWLTDEIAVFTKILYDDGFSSGSSGKFRLDGAYFLFDLIPQFEAKVGRIPITIGNFPQRSYLERNPLIGSPLMYHYRLSILPDEINTIDGILTFRGKRSGVTFLYESCWDTGVEVSGSHSKIDYSAGVTNASVFSPKSSNNNGEQYIGRIGVRPVLGMRLGVGYARAPYAFGGIDSYVLNTSEGSILKNLSAGREVEDYTGEIILADFEYSFGHMEVYSEWAKSWFETGADLRKLSAISYYIETKYSITPHLYAAGRIGQMIFEDVKSSTGEMEPWDYDISRIEVGLGYKISRSMVIKGVGQFNVYGDAPLEDWQFFALQLKAFM